ncbi:hypothetical protein ACIPH4_00055 [Streptomyces tendae]|uniref:hypothetical protein n=1 Tax=Streptomyces tendae TaxID=1932 RepID=UPI0036B8BC5B
MPLTTEQRRRNEASIRAAMDRLLLGQLPARGGCNLKTLAREAGVARTGFYARTDPQGNQRPGPYQHLAEEFQRRLADLREAGAVSDPRELQITRDHARSAQSAVNGIAAVSAYLGRRPEPDVRVGHASGSPRGLASGQPLLAAGSMVHGVGIRAPR